MKFQVAKDNEAYYERLISEDGRIEMGIYPVAFGYRVRAGYVGNQWSEIDWCGGADQGQVEMLYSIAKNILENHGSFSGLPIASKIKPFFHDGDFVETIHSKVTKPFELIKLKPLSEYRNQLFKKL